MLPDLQNQQNLQNQPQMISRSSTGGHHNHYHRGQNSGSRMPELNWGASDAGSNHFVANFPSISPSPNLFSSSQDFGAGFDFAMFGDINSSKNSSTGKKIHYKLKLKYQK